MKLLLTGATGYIAQRLIPVMVAPRWLNTRSQPIATGNVIEFLSGVLLNEKTLKKIGSMGGENGWYYGDWLWGMRGFIDKLFGGVGLRRGRKNQTEISPGDTLDFWRVLIADKTEKRLLLFAEMKLPGEAWLEFRIDNNNILHQTATFRPLGLWGRLYWYSMMPFHGYIFNGMLRNIAGD